MSDVNGLVLTCGVVLQDERHRSVARGQSDLLRTAAGHVRLYHISSW